MNIIFKTLIGEATTNYQSLEYLRKSRLENLKSRPILNTTFEKYLETWRRHSKDKQVSIDYIIDTHRQNGSYNISYTATSLTFLMMTGEIILEKGRHGKFLFTNRKNVDPTTLTHKTRTLLEITEIL